MAGRLLNTRQHGQHWEKAAESFLQQEGLRLLARNFSSRFGEIDLIMEDGETLVFVEVRYRKSTLRGSGAETVTLQKQGRLSRTAGWYLVKNPTRSEQYCRFDVVSIDSQQVDPNVYWIKSAFYSTIG
jgi:putative endonuclease